MAAALPTGNAMEAEGLDIVRHALEVDGRLTVVRCHEGARADFVVHRGDPSHGLGVQLKTTRFARTASVNSRQYHFSCTQGYEGLSLLCMALGSRVRLWLMPGSVVKSPCVNVPTESQSTRRRYAEYETFELDLADDFCKILADPGVDYNLRPVEEFLCPDSKNGSAEYKALQRLKERLPLQFVPAAIEGGHFDCTVDGSRWQLKLANYQQTTDRYTCTAQKQAGRALGKRNHTQYSCDDFDYLCVQMPAPLEEAYLFPMAVLKARRLADRSDCTNATIHFYPHRRAQTRSDWVKDFRIDLSSPATALKCYRRVASRELPSFQ